MESVPEIAARELPHDASRGASEDEGESRRDWQRWILVVALAGYWGLLVEVLSVDWETNPQYSYGWLVPLLSLYLFWKRWPGRPEPVRDPASQKLALPMVGILAVLFLPTKLVAESSPDWAVMRWAMAFEVVGLTLAVFWRLGGSPTMRYFAWPIGFFLVAVAWPSGFENALIQGLMQQVALVTAEIVGFAGYAAEPMGNLIRLDVGVVGVDEACSGVRSLQSMLMASLFLGELHRCRGSGRLALVGAGLALAVFFNVLRSLTLVAIAINSGLGALEKWHDSAGFSILLLSFGTLLLLVRFFGFGGRQEEAGEDEDGAARPDSGLFVSGKAMGTCLVGWLLLVVAVTHWWYSKEDIHPWQERWTVRFPETENQFKDLPVAPNVRKVLGYSEGRQATWIDNTGAHWTMFSFQWAPGRTSMEAARQHRPDICLPATGRVLEEEVDGPVIVAGSHRLAFKRYLFRTRGEPMHVFFCLWEAGNKDFANTAMSQDWNWLSRLQRVWARQRNLGQQSVEVVISGVEKAGEAESAFRAQMQRSLARSATDRRG